MEYTDDKAKEIAAKHKISPSTLKVWKTRGSIPDKYQDENFQIGTKVNNQEDIDRIILKIDHPAINKEVLLEKLGINKSYADLKRGKTSLSQQEIEGIKKEFALLKVQINNALNSKAVLKIKHILNISYLKYRPIFEQLSKTEYDRIMRQREGKELVYSDFMQFKDCIMKFIVQL